MSRALVTGGAGFLGSHVAEQLVQMGLEVVVLDDLSGGFRCNVPAGARLVEGSIVDERAVEELFRHERFRYVFHLAAYAAEGLSHHIRRFNYLNNVVGSAQLISAAVNHEVERFVYTSSAAVYGSAVDPVSEDVVATPEDPYGIAKLAVERDLAVAHRHFGLRYVVFRPHNVYGERQNLSDPYRNVVGIFMRQVMQGQPCTIFGDGEQTRAFSYVDDVAPLIARSVEVPAAAGRVFNIGSDRSYTIGALARRVQQALGCEVGVHHMPERPESRHLVCDHARLRDVFGNRDTVTLEDGLARMATWAGEIDPRAPRRFARIEIARHLPPSWEKLLDP